MTIRRYILESTPPPEPLDIEPGGFAIENKGAADWALSRMCEIQEYLADVDAQAKLATDRIAQRVTELKRAPSNDLAFMQGALLDYAAGHKEALLGAGRKKSCDFVHGRIGWRKKGGKLKVTDPDQLREWAIAEAAKDPTQGLVRVKIEPAVDAIKAYVAERQMVPPGMEWEDERDEAYVQTDFEQTDIIKR